MVPTEQITDERLDRWKKRLSESHSTPILLMGVGHDHVFGRPVLCTTEDITNEQLCVFLRAAIDALSS